MKLKKAKEINGPTFIAIDAPCCLGQGFDGGITIKVAKLAIQARLWYLFEIENGKYKLNFNPSNPKPVKEYLELQKRFRHLDEKQIEHIQKQADINYENLLEKAGMTRKEESK